MDRSAAPKLRGDNRRRTQDMRIFPIVTAALVTLFLLILVLERETLMGWVGAGEEDAAPVADSEPLTQAAAPEAETQPIKGVRVMAMRSVAREVDSAVVLRGETEALRQVEIRAETSGKIIGEPLRRGAFVEAGQLMCEIDVGTRNVSLQEAAAQLAEAKSRLPEARARLAEAEAQLPAARARITEARANIPAAEAALMQARAGVPAAQARLKEAEARLPEAEARQVEAQARVKEAEINLQAARELARDGFASQTRLASTEATHESALAQLQAARSQIENARAGIETARSNVQSADAAVQSALSQLEGAHAAAISAEAALEGALAGVQSAKAGTENAASGISSAEAGIASAEKEIERLGIHAPFAGLLETDTAELGALLQPGSACATVIQLNPIKIVGFVPETDVSRVRLDALAGARLVDGREVTGRVSFVSRSSDPVTRTFRVELEVANDDLSIRDGQTAEIAIEAEGAPAHLVPQSALTLNNEGKLGIRSVDADSLAAFLPVTVLRDTPAGMLVTGLPDEVSIITVGQEYVTDGVAVTPVYEEVVQ
jgi:multidrug efflux system membrane fusion protein